MNTNTFTISSRDSKSVSVQDIELYRNEYIKEVFQRVENEFNEEELELIENLLTKMTNDFMPEIASFKDNLRFKKE